MDSAQTILLWTDNLPVYKHYTDRLNKSLKVSGFIPMGVVFFFKLHHRNSTA